MMTQADLTKQSEDFSRIESAIQYLEQSFREQPSLDEIAESVHLSKYHFQRLFKRWAGVSPSQFLQYLTLEYAKARLKESQSILDTSLDAGLSSPSRLHDLFVTFEAVTPGEYKRAGAGLELLYGAHPSPFGECVVAMTERGICGLRFVTPTSGRAEILAQLKREWPQAEFFESSERTGPVIHRLFSAVNGDEDRRFHLVLKGTNFQVQVWRALMHKPKGSLFSYQDVAARIGSPKATRAVANAIARNPIAYLIPCHRVISKVGKAHRYKWGASRKKAMLGWEASRTHEVAHQAGRAACR